MVLDWYNAKLIEMVKESKLINNFCSLNDSIGTSQEQISVIKIQMIVIEKVNINYKKVIEIIL